MSTKKFFTIFMIIFMLFSVSGCGGSGGHTQNITNNPVSPDKPVPIPEPQSDDITIIPEPSPLSQDKPVSQEPIPTPIISHDPVPTPILYTVIFNSNGGSAVSSLTVSSGNTVTKPNDPSKYGYTFDGWYKDSALTQVFRFGSNGDKITGNITLYAKWIETDRLRAEFAIGKISIGYQDGDNASNVTKNLTLPTSLNVSGDVNISWSSNTPSVISNSGTVTRPSGRDVAVVLTAKATAGSASRTKTFTVTVIHEATPTPSGYTVTFNSNGGSAVASIHTSSGGTVAMPENPTKTGYVFAGWYKDEVFTEIFTFGADGDKITKNTTLYAQWFDADLLVAEYALSEIVIGYENGDNPKYVTQNLTLSTKVGSADISWTSSSGAVSTNGTVTRQAEDVDITLTARASYNGKYSEPKTFELRVIRKRTRDNSAIVAVSLEEASSGDIEVTRNTSGDVTDIEGQYVSFDIRNADDALDAVTVIKNELGVKSPDSELQLNGATINEYGAKYSFGQFYNGLKVWGRRIIVSANSLNKANFLNSNFMSSTAFDNANLNAGISQSRAVEIAKENYSDDVEYTAKEVIYSFGKYENSPARVWIITISGTQKDGHYADETFFIKSSDGTIISKSSNTKNMTSNYGVNELNQVVQFPVTYEYSPLELQGFNYMLDTDLNIEVFYERMPERLFALNRVRLELNKLWTDRHQVSAYTNN